MVFFLAEERAKIRQDIFLYLALFSSAVVIYARFMPVSPIFIPMAQFLAAAGFCLALAWHCARLPE
jgi:hypothetical protein